MLDDEEIPRTEDITYLIEGAPKIEQTEEIKPMTENQKGSDATIIYCIDTSRSMGSRENGRSRIKWLQVAIMKQLKDLNEKFPNSKVGLVTFNGGLFVVGDGSKEKVFYDG